MNAVALPQILNWDLFGYIVLSTSADHLLTWKDEEMEHLLQFFDTDEDGKASIKSQKIFESPYGHHILARRIIRSW